MKRVNTIITTKTTLTRLLSQCTLLCLIASCTQQARPIKQVPADSEQTSLKAAEMDSAPTEPKKHLDTIPNATPKWEKKSRYGNPESYEVFGIKYYVKDSNKDFTQSGLASWYGTKFHGRRTSSGEPYDMYAMTAAHKTLPLPTYVQVHNLDNDRSIIVKVNDRGPFHEGRIIDLSYTAAHQLGVLDKGTARVEIKTITPNKPNNMSVAKSTASKMTHTKINPTYIQLGAFSARHNAETLQRRLAKTPQLGDIQINQRKNDPKKLYRVQLGPIKDQQHLNKTQQLLAQQGIPSQLIIPSSPIE